MFLNRVLAGALFVVVAACAASHPTSPAASPARPSNDSTGSGEAVKKSSETPPVSVTAPVATPTAPTLLHPPIDTLSVGTEQACAIGADKNVYCWGLKAKAAPLGGGFTDAVGVSVGRGRTCVLREHGIVTCVGVNPGVNGSRYDVPGVPMARVVRTEKGSFVACLAGVDGSVWCWGRHGDRGKVEPPRRIGDISAAVDIALGDGGGCALLSDGSVSCWDEHGEPHLMPSTAGAAKAIVSYVGATGILRDRRLEFHDIHSRDWIVQLGELPSPIVNLTVGYDHACFSTGEGDVRCFGHTALGAVGVDDEGRVDAPVVVQGVRDVVELAAGWWTTCARTKEGVFCWGDGSRGIVPVADAKTSTYSRLPLKVQGLPADP